MKKTTMMRAAVLAACCGSTMLAYGQIGKPGLWETTVTMNWEKMPMTPDQLAQMKNMPNNPFQSGAKTSIRMCVDQAMVDKWGGPEPHMQKECTMDNVQKSLSGMSATMHCAGALNGTGDFKTTMTDSSHITSHSHFAGSMHGNAAEWTADGTSTYIGSDCGSIAPGKFQVLSAK